MPPKKNPTPISLRQYAKRRGVSAMAVSKAVAAGRLKASVTHVRGQPKIADPALADREWDASTDHSKAPGYVKEREAARAAGEAAPPPPDVAAAGTAELGMSLAEASATEKVWKAKIAELDFRERSGELVNAKEAAEAFGNAITLCRTKLLGLPTRAKLQLPDLTAADVGAIDRIVREALEELAVAAVDLDEADDPEAVGA